LLDGLSSSFASVYKYSIIKCFELMLLVGLQEGHPACKKSCNKNSRQAVVRGTTNPAPCCHVANEIFMQTEDRQTYQPPWTKSAATKRVQTRCPIPLAVILITNKLTFDPPTRLPELTQNVIRSSHGHSTPSLKISCKSVQPFSRNVADKETKKERNKSPENNTPSTYRGQVKITCRDLTDLE